MMTITDNGILYENFNAFLVHKEDELISELGIERWRVINMWKEQTSGDNSIWLPQKVSEEILGEVISVQEAGKYGRQMVIRDEKLGKSLTTPSHKVLQARLSNIKVGDLVKIVYDGEQPPRVRGENPIKMYRVFREEVTEEKVN